MDGFAGGAKEPQPSTTDNDTCARRRIMSAPQAANEKAFGGGKRRDGMEEWNAFHDSYDLCSERWNKKLQMTGYGWCADRGRQKGETTAAKENLRLLLE
jgi:hypothetical protein